MNSENYENREVESYDEISDKLVRLVGYMNERDGELPSFEDGLIEMIQTKEFPVLDLEFQTLRYAEVWQDVVGSVDIIKYKESFENQNLKKNPKNRKSALKSIKNFNKKQKILTVFDKNKKKTILLFIGLFIIICFYYEWFTNLISHVELFFRVKDDSFLGIIALVFWGIVCVSTGLFLGYRILKRLFINEGQEPFLNSESVGSNNKIMIGLCVVFFFFFSSSTKYFHNYVGLKLEDISEDEYTISGEDYLEHYEIGEVPDEIVYEILEVFDNNLFEIEEKEHLINRIDAFGKYYEYIAFKSENFIFKETGAFQGYSTYSLEEGFFSYLKCLFFSFLEISFRAIIFFLIAGIIILPLRLLSLKLNGEQLHKLINYGGSILFFAVILYVIYLVCTTFFEWIKSIFN